MDPPSTRVGPRQAHGALRRSCWGTKLFTTNTVSEQAVRRGFAQDRATSRRSAPAATSRGIEKDLLGKLCGLRDAAMDMAAPNTEVYSRSSSRGAFEAPVAQWIRRLPTEQEILGSIPGGGITFCYNIPLFADVLVGPSPCSTRVVVFFHLFFSYSAFPQTKRRGPATRATCQGNPDSLSP